MAATVKSNLFHSGQSQNLGDILAKSFKYSVFPEGTSNRFIPNGHVEDFVTSDAVMREFFGRNLPDWSPSSKKEVEELVQYVISSAKKLLAISILSGVRSNNLQRAMEEFKQHDFGDNDLPLLIENVDQYPPCFGEWGFLSKENFRNEQWRLVVPVFPRDFERIHLRPEHILPFTYVDSVRKEGTFGDVYQVTIHELHQEDPMRKADGSLANAAIKELKAWAASGNLGDGKGKAQQVFKEWQAEAKALEDTSRLKHEHIVTVKSIFTKGPRHYFMFQWADGGSLRDLYRTDLRPYLTAELIEEMVQQLLGLSDALSALHNYRKVESPDQPRQTSLLEVPRPAQNDESYRHGDLKPENILRFEDNTKVGLWKIADMGLARHHLAATDLRGPTDTLNATPSYEPPEVYTMPDQGRSRQYDVWSMGCIILELLVWMLYGPDAMIKFIKSMNGDTGQRFPYWEFVPGTKNKEARLREVVLKCMAHIRNDPECQRSTATRDLLKIVQEKLLVVNLPVNRPSGFGSAVSASALMSGPKRAKAETFRGALDAICDEGKKRKAYWFTGTERTKIAGPHQSAIPKEPEVQLQTYTHDPLHNTWEFPIDNSFVQSLFNDPKVWAETVVRPYVPANLCGSCMKMDLWQEDFNIQDDTRELEVLSGICDFCNMRWSYCKAIDRSYGTKVYFDKRQSHLRLNEGYPPVLTLHYGPTLNGEVDKSGGEIQRGLPQLPQPGGAAHIKILRHWLTDCDLNHKTCANEITRSLPTRLIYVGNRNNPSLRLHETQSTDSMRYFALSHPWGEPPHFCTLRSNIARHALGMAFKTLPLTFQHAVAITRDLGVEYLWIDSICIIQGEDGDFKYEASRMEDVFSNAYCVLAASSASGQHDGFLKERHQRKSLLLRQSGNPPVFVCEFIDDFHHDVLESNLSRRGWVLQERALARRTIYFTDKQTYWECGEGVRSETMTRMHNTLASFLGDPNFPKIAIESSRGGKILLHQSLCMQYSRLALTRQTDRPIAISGLEKRLVESLGLTGGFGALHDEKNLGLLRRSMLWHRASDCSTMKRISFHRGAPPTWSWMAYEGQIEYLDLPFRKMDWASFERDFQTPWAVRKAGRWYSSSDTPDSMAMTVIVRDLELSSSLTVQAAQIILDITNGTGIRRPSKCVVLGRLVETSAYRQDDSGTSFAVLLVSEGTAPQQISGIPVYIRMGVASVPGSWIKTAKDGSKGLLM